MTRYFKVEPHIKTRKNDQTTVKLSTFASTLLDDESASAARTTLGIGTATGTNTGDQNIFQTIAVSGQSNVVADSTTDTLTLAAGANITITTDATTDTITIAASGGGTLADGDYGDITVSGSGTVMNIDAGVITTTELGGDVTTAGKALLDDATAADQRTTLGLGTLATQSGTFSGTSSGTNTGDQNLFSTIAVSGQSDVVADTTSDTLTLVAGSNITITTNAGTDTITITGATQTPNIKQTEIDFGSTPVESYLFTVVDADVSGTSQLIATVAYEAPTGKDLDELDCDTLDIKCAPGTGQFDLFVRSTDGSYLADKFKINYLIG